MVTNNDVVLPQQHLLQNRYEIKSVIGIGGFGITYFAWDTLLEKNIAIKEYYPNGLVNRTVDRKVSVFVDDQVEEFERGKNRFLREARELSRFTDCKNVVSVFDFFEANNTAYMIMEYLQGNTLKGYMDSHGGRVEESMAVNVIFTLMDTLETIHTAGVVHRDIAPDNVFICSDNTIKLLDFGAARQATKAELRSGSVILKAGYAPVEQYSKNGRIGPWTDIYAFGAMIYHMMTGVRPEDSVDRMMEDHLKPPGELNPDISVTMERVILKAMSVNAEDRYQNIKEMRDDYLSDGTEKMERKSAAGKEDSREKTGQRDDIKESSAKAGMTRRMKVILITAAVAAVFVCICMIALMNRDKGGNVSGNAGGSVKEDPGKTYAVSKPDPTGWTEKNKIYIYYWNDSFRDEMKVFLERFPEYTPYIEYRSIKGTTAETTKEIGRLLDQKDAYPSIIAAETKDSGVWLDDPRIMDLKTLGFDEKVLSNCYNMSMQYSSDGSNSLKSVSLCTNGGCVFYNRKIASEVFGSDDPELVQEKLSDWASFRTAAEELSGHGYKIVSSIDEIYLPIINSRTEPWFYNENGKTVFRADSSIMNYAGLYNYLDVNGYTNGTKQGSAEWTDDMKPQGKAFLYFRNPSQLRTMQSAASTNGGWGVIKGPSAFYWGDVYYSIGKDTPNPELSAFFLYELICDPEIGVRIANTKGSSINNKEVMKRLSNGELNEKNNSVLFLGGQDPYRVWSEVESELKEYPVDPHDTLVKKCLGKIKEYLKEENGDQKVLTEEELAAVISNMEKDVNAALAEEN